MEADAYIRDGRIICAACSDIEDRDHSTRLRQGDHCSICGELIEYPIPDGMRRV